MFLIILSKNQHGGRANFEPLEFMISAALWKILKGDMHKKLLNEEKWQKKEDPIRILSGRQIAFRIFEHFTLPSAEKECLDVTHLVNLELKNDSVKQFNTRWDEITIQIKELPPEGWLEALNRKQLEQSPQVAQVLALYKNDISQQREKASYKRLTQMIEYHLADVQHQAHKKNLAMSKPGMAAGQADTKRKTRQIAGTGRIRVNAPRKITVVHLSIILIKRASERERAGDAAPHLKVAERGKRGDLSPLNLPDLIKNRKKPGRGKSPSGRINQTYVGIG